jgi:hypothetical protein
VSAAALHARARAASRAALTSLAVRLLTTTRNVVGRGEAVRENVAVRAVARKLVAVDQQQADELAANPSESLALEIKTWIDPDSPEGRAKIVKSCIALRNFDGGRLLIGFNNDTGAPEVNTVLQDVKASYHIDKIQAMVTKQASEAFEIEVRWIERDGQSYPLIVVPAGVKSPVAARSPIVDAQSHSLIEQDCVYVRSLQSNNTPATTKATWRDWPELVARCFENREADIGRFVRRHLTPDVIQQLRETLGSAQPAPTPPSLEEQALRFLEESAARFQAVASELPQPLPPHGAWEVAAVAGEPVQKYATNTTFLNLITSNNPKYTRMAALDEQQKLPRADCVRGVGGADRRARVGAHRLLASFRCG